VSGARPTTVWDLTALLNAADARASLPERQLWLVRLMEWVKHAPGAPRNEADLATPAPIVRLRHWLNVLDQQPAHRGAVQAMLRAFRKETDAVALFADFGFSNRMALGSALWERMRARLLPGSPATRDLATLFPLLFDGRDAAWIEQLDDTLLARIANIAFPPDEVDHWRAALLDALIILASAVQASGFSSPLRQRMSPALLADQPFRQLSTATERLREALNQGAADAARQQAVYLRALLDSCRRAADSIADHLEEYGVSVDIVFETDQLRERTLRIEQLLDTLLAERPADETRRLIATLARVVDDQRGVRKLMARHYSQLARQVAERHAETGEHYITRTRAEYRDMLRRAAGGGSVIAGTTFVKFGLAALGLSAFWSGLFAGLNYAASFVLIMLLQWTVATKQPAMTAPALAATLGRVREASATADARDDAVAVEAFVDEVVRLIRSQVAGIFGNLALCAPLVLGVQYLAWASFGAPVVSPKEAEHVLHALSLLGPTPLYAAFTGVLLFASSLVAGWTENWFVFHRLDSAIAWNPRIVQRLGAARAQRWAAWWRANISGLAGNISLGLLLGLVPALFAFFGLPIEVRHVTLSTGQLAAALGAEGLGLLRAPAFWWCVAAVGVTGVLNLSVSFWLAFKLALRSRSIHLPERRRIYAALRRRLVTRPLGFLWPPRD
jgi:site-specific recombinase